MLVSKFTRLIEGEKCTFAPKSSAVHDRPKNLWESLLCITDKFPSTSRRETHKQKTHKCFLTKCSKEFLELLVRVVFTKVFNVDVGELHSFGAELHLPLLTRLKVADKTAEKNQTGRRGGTVMTRHNRK